MTKTELLKSMAQISSTEHRNSAQECSPAIKDENHPIKLDAQQLAKDALQQFGILSDSPYYAGAVQNIQHALDNWQPLAWWKSYQDVLRDKQNELEATDPAGNALQHVNIALPVVNAIIFAMEVSANVHIQPIGE